MSRSFSVRTATGRAQIASPGESKHARIGISLPGAFEEPKAPVYVDGRLHKTLKGERVVAEFIEILERYAAERCAAAASGSL